MLDLVHLDKEFELQTALNREHCEVEKLFSVPKSEIQIFEWPLTAKVDSILRKPVMCFSSLLDGSLLITLERKQIEYNIPFSQLCRLILNLVLTDGFADFIALV